MIQYSVDEQKEIFSQGGNENHDTRQQEMHQKKALVAGSATAMGQANLHHKYATSQANGTGFRSPIVGEAERLQTKMSNIGHTTDKI